MSNTIQIKRSATVATPTSLAQGELAYSESTGTGDGELFIGLAGSALEKIGGQKDVAKLLTIETSADVTDATNVAAAGALMDSELTSIASVKALNQGVATTDTPSFSGLTSTGNIDVTGSNKLLLGGADQFEIYGDTTLNGYIKNTGTGNLHLLDDNNVIIADEADLQPYADFSGANVKLYAEAAGGASTAVKLQTTADGVDIIGDLDLAGNKAKFSTTLEVYADAFASSIDDSSSGGMDVRTGRFHVRDSAGTKEAFNTYPDGATTLYYDGVAKLGTVTGGVSVTGDLGVSGTVDGRDVSADGLLIDDAVLQAATSTASMDFVIDEDTMVSDTSTKVPTQQSVKAYVDTQITTALTSEMTFKGDYNASTNAPNLDAGTIVAIAKGDTYVVTVAGNFFTTAVEIGDTIMAKQVAATAVTHWVIVNKNLDYATATVSGTIELATQTEVNTGTDTVRAVTPSTFSSAVIDGGTF